MKTTKTNTSAKTIRYRTIPQLCALAAQLGVPIVSLISWPGDTDWPLDAVAIYARSRGRGTAKLLRRLRILPPVIFLGRSVAANPRAIAHEISHDICARSDAFDVHRDISPRLQRVACRAGISPYCRSTRQELRAECVGRRLLGRKLPTMLLRLTARAWAELEQRTAAERAV